MNENILTVIGNVVSDPVQRTTRDGTRFAAFRLASNGRRVDFSTGEYIDTGTNFFDITAWRAMGLNVMQCVRKGQPLVVHGKLRITQWTKDGRTGTRVEIDAYNLGHDLRAGRSTFERVARATLAVARPGGEESGHEEPGIDGREVAAGQPLDPEAVTDAAWERRRYEDDLEARADTDEYVLAPAVGE